MKESIKYIYSLIDGFNAEKMKRDIAALQLSNDFEHSKQKSPESRHYEFNLLDFFGTSETSLSAILASLLSYCDHSGKMPVLQSFIETFMPEVDSSDFNYAKVSTEKHNIDILVTGHNKCIIIENKIKNAVYQRNQIARYIKRLEDLGFKNEDTYIVLIPLYNSCNYVDEMRKSVWRAPKDWYKPNAERACCWFDQYHCLCDDDVFSDSPICEGCVHYFDKFKERTVVIHHKFVEWLETMIKRIDFCKDVTIPATCVLLVDWLRNLYGINENQKLIKYMHDYLLERLFGDNGANLSDADKLNIVSKQIGEVNNLLENLNKIRNEYKNELYSKWKREVVEYLKSKGFEERFLQDQESNMKSFGVQLSNGLRIGLWISGNIANPFFWGIWTNAEITQTLKDESRNIVNKCIDIHAQSKKENWLDWNYTMSGSEVVIRLLDAALSLGYF